MSQKKQTQNYSANYFVPIDRQSLTDVIPHGNQIAYSSNLFIRYELSNVNQLSGVSPTVAFITGGIPGVIIGKLFNSLTKSISGLRGSYYTDALFTSEGVAINLPTFEFNSKSKRYKKVSPSPHFISWNHISLYKNGEMLISSVFKSKFNFIEDFETKENFNNRILSFYDFIVSKRKGYTKKCIEHAQSALEANNKEEALEWIEKGFKSNVNRSEFDYSEELSSLKGGLKQEEINKKLKLIEDIDNYIINYLKSNSGRAFTAESMMKRFVNELNNREWKEYLAENLNGELNKLVFAGDIKSNQHQGQTFYLG